MLGPVAIAPSGCGAGVGMFASRDVQPGEVLFAVPKRLHVRLDTALADIDCGDEFTAKLKDGNAVSVFCAYLAKQHLCDDEGLFAPYLGSLDLGAPGDFVQSWSDEEVELFRGAAGLYMAPWAAALPLRVHSASSPQARRSLGRLGASGGAAQPVSPGQPRGERSESHPTSQVAPRPTAERWRPAARPRPPSP